MEIFGHDMREVFGFFRVLIEIVPNEITTMVLFVAAASFFFNLAAKFSDSHS